MLSSDKLVLPDPAHPTPDSELPTSPMVAQPAYPSSPPLVAPPTVLPGETSGYAGVPPQFPYYQHNQSVHVAVGGPNIAVLSTNNGPGFFVRAIYFIFLGWYLGGIWIVLSYLMIIPIVTIPIFAKMINMLPQVMTLRPRTTNYRTRQEGDLTIIEQSTQEQHPFWIRAIWFVLVGFWLVAIWLTLAYLLALTVIGLPLAFMMFNRAGAVATLYRN